MIVIVLIIVVVYSPLHNSYRKLWLFFVYISQIPLPVVILFAKIRELDVFVQINQIFVLVHFENIVVHICQFHIFFKIIVYKNFI